MKVYVVRHCTTEYSAKKIFCGSTDAPLTETGKREAERLTEYFRSVPLGHIISSPLLRARETAQAIAGGRVPILLDARLREREFGDFEGTDCARGDAGRFRHCFFARYPSGESYADLVARIYPLLDGLRAFDEDLCLVSHGSACRVIRSYFAEMTDEEFYGYSQPNGSVEEYTL